MQLLQGSVFFLRRMARLLINVGVMRFVTPDVTIPIRSKTLPLKVKKDSSYSEVFAEALIKHEAHDIELRS